jgi:streptogramin lyase
MKIQQLRAILVGMVMTAWIACARADLYVGGHDSDSILRYDEVTGHFMDAFVPSGSAGLRRPRGLLIGRDGNFYVSSFGTNNVLRFDGTTGAPLPAPGKTGAVFASGGGLQGPSGLILGADGNLYVVSQGNHSVLRYSGTTGDFLDTFVPTGQGGLNTARGLVFGPDGNLYVNSDGTQSVMRYDGATGTPLPAPGQTGAVFASGLAEVSSGLVFGPDGNLYVADYLHSSVVRINGTTGELRDTFVSSGSGGLSGADGVIFGPDNNLYVCSGEADSNSVLRYDGTTGAFIDVFVSRSSGGLIAPDFLFFTHTDPTTLAYVPPRSRLLITAASTAVSGTPFDVTVTALDPSGNTDTNYQGTVSFSTTDPDPGVVLPADYTFTTGDGGDNGVHTFPGGVTLVTVGDQTLTVADNVSGITGTITVTVGPGP